MAYVYRHIRIDKNEPFYIGISGNNDNYRRAYSILDRNMYWKRIVAKTKYDVEIMLDDLTWEDVCEKEKEFILLYGRRDLGKGVLVNLTDGGEGLLNHKISEETSIKMGKAQLGNKKYLLRTTPQEEVNKKISLANKGRVMSEEQKEKIRNNFKINGHPCLGKILTDETKQKIRDSKKKCKVIQKDFQGNIIKIWESTKSVIPFGFNQSNVWKCCHNIHKQHKGYIWEYYKQ
jgi:hypothetical protein